MTSIITLAYAEVLAVLAHMESKYVDQIPKNLIEMFERNKDKNYNPVIDPYTPLSEQNLFRETLALLASLNLDYWCKDEEHKKELKKLYAVNDVLITEALIREWEMHEILG